MWLENKLTWILQTVVHTLFSFWSELSSSLNHVVPTMGLDWAIILPPFHVSFSCPLPAMHIFRLFSGGLLGSVYVLIFLANGRDKKYNIRKEKIKSKTKKNKLRVKPEATYIYKDRTYLNQMRITFEYSHCKPLLRI